MAFHIPHWLQRHKQGEREVSLADVAPEHPNEYPAKHLKEILDGRRTDFEERASHPTGMLDGPGPLT